MHKTGAAIQSFHFATLASGYDAGTFTPVDVAQTVLARIEAAGDDKVWISRATDAALMARASMLSGLDPAMRGRLALYGLPFAVGDCTDGPNGDDCRVPGFRLSCKAHSKLRQSIA